MSDIASQDRAVRSLTSLFEHTTIADRRQQPSHGYRAVHVIAECQGKLIEIQVRTSLQHLWAELSEKLSDVSDPAIKYGGGNEKLQTTLKKLSSAVTLQESTETMLADRQTQLSSQGNLTDAQKQQLVEIQEELISIRQEIFELLRNAIERVEKGEYDDLSD